MRLVAAFALLLVTARTTLAQPQATLPTPADPQTRATPPTPADVQPHATPPTITNSQSQATPPTITNSPPQATSPTIASSQPQANPTTPADAPAQATPPTIAGSPPQAQTPAPWVFPAEDDPKLARGAPRPTRSIWRISHPVARFALSYRLLWTASLTGGKLPFDVGELEYFPVSNLIRFGVEGEFGWAGGTYGQWYTLFGATLGIQYPARVTPFLEGRFVAGLSGGSYLGQSVFSWMYQGGLEGGADIYYARRFYVTLAIGWAHPVYAAVDIADLMEKPAKIVHKSLSDDTFTFKIGLGL